MSEEEKAAWKHWDVSVEIAEEVRRYVAQGESLNDLELIDRIQAILRDRFPHVEATCAG